MLPSPLPSDLLIHARALALEPDAGDAREAARIWTLREDCPPELLHATEDLGAAPPRQVALAAVALEEVIGSLTEPQDGSVVTSPDGLRRGIFYLDLLTGERIVLTHQKNPQQDSEKQRWGRLAALGWRALTDSDPPVAHITALTGEYGDLRSDQLQESEEIQRVRLAEAKRRWGEERAAKKRRDEEAEARREERIALEAEVSRFLLLCSKKARAPLHETVGGWCRPDGQIRYYGIYEASKVLREWPHSGAEAVSWSRHTKHWCTYPRANLSAQLELWDFVRDHGRNLLLSQYAPGQLNHPNRVMSFDRDDSGHIEHVVWRERGTRAVDLPRNLAVPPDWPTAKDLPVLRKILSLGYGLLLPKRSNSPSTVPKRQL